MTGYLFALRLTTNKRLRKARRRYVLKIYSLVIENPTVIFIYAKRMHKRGWYSTKTSPRDVVYSIFGYMEKHAKQTDQLYQFRKTAQDKGLFLIWRKVNYTINWE